MSTKVEMRDTDVPRDPIPGGHAPNMEYPQDRMPSRPAEQRPKPEP